MAVCMIQNCRKKCPGDEPFCADHRDKEDAHKAALMNVVRAWEELDGGKNYSAKQIEWWLVHQMTPAINRARRVLGGKSGHRLYGNKTRDVEEAEERAS